MHKTIIDHCDSDHSGRSYRIHIMKTGKVVTKIAGHIKTTPVLAEEYLREQILKQSDKYICRNYLYRHYK